MQNPQEKINFINWLTVMLKEFFSEVSTKPEYEVIDIFECKKSDCTKAVIRLSGRHTIEKNISEIIVDSDLIGRLDKKTIRTLTYLATIEQLKPDYSIVAQQLSDQVDEYLFELKSKNKKTTFKKTSTEITKDKSILKNLDSIDASRIGYLAGVRETVKEFAMKNQKTSER